MLEEWREINGFEGFYEVSSEGRVRSLDRTITNSKGVAVRLKGKYLSPSIAGDYLTLLLCREGFQKAKKVHLLVLETFVGPRPGPSDYWHGCHNDGNVRNNALSNLRWDTRLGNVKDTITHGTISKGERHGRSKLTEAKVMEIKERLNAGDTLQKIAGDYGVSHQTISLIKKGSIWGWVCCNPNLQIKKDRASA